MTVFDNSFDFFFVHFSDYRHPIRIEIVLSAFINTASPRKNRYYLFVFTYRPYITDAQLQSFPGTEEEDFYTCIKFFLSYMGITAILVN